jgi:hypothetical protein
MGIYKILVGRSQTAENIHREGLAAQRWLSCFQYVTFVDFVGSKKAQKVVRKVGIYPKVNRSTENRLLLDS